MQIAFGRVRRKTSPAGCSVNVNIFLGFTIKEPGFGGWVEMGQHTDTKSGD